MERLTARSNDLNNKITAWFVDRENGNRRLEPCEMDSHHSGVAIRRLAEYEDSVEEGRLLLIEVKIGDKASVIDKDYETDKMKVYDGIWERVCYVQSKDGSYSIHGEVSYDVYDFFYNDGRTMKHAMFVGQESTKVGERVFIGENAHEQAEEKLRELIK